MKIGFFDSGIGGLLVARAVKSAMPDIDIAYLGDTLNVPYGGRSTDVIYGLSERAIGWLLREQDCAIVVLACNTATAAALRRLQQEYLPEHFPDRRILGVIAPLVEEAISCKFSSVGIVATAGTVRSGAYVDEFKNRAPGMEVRQVATPLIVPLVENDGDKYAADVIRDYIAPLAGVEALLLACTHYPYYKDIFRAEFAGQVLSQDEIVPQSLVYYLERHTDIADKLGRSGSFDIFMTDVNQGYIDISNRIFLDGACVKRVEL